jgi:hypothetical protein
MRQAEHVARMGETRNADEILMEKPEENTLIRRPKHRWENDIKMDI